MENKMKRQFTRLTNFSRLRLGLFTMTIILSTSCNSYIGDTTEPIPIKELVFPDSQYYNALIQTNNDLIVLVEGGDLSDLQSYAIEGHQDFAQFNFPVDTYCTSPRYHSYETFPNGRLQVWKICLTENGKVTDLLAYNWMTRQLTTVSGQLPPGTSGASWNPEQTIAIAYLDGGFATRTLFWMFDSGYTPLDLVISDQSQSWNLSDDFPDFKANDTGKTGTTGRAAWSPDGKSIAFFASPDAIGKTGFERFGVEHNLYLMNPETRQYEVVADKIFSPFLLAWSPDSTHIAFVGNYGFWKENGIWLYSVETDSVTEISKGKFQGIVWRPDGKSLVAIKCENLDVCNEILEYDLSSILE
jgi:WD40 repeat protein